MGTTGPAFTVDVYITAIDKYGRSKKVSLAEAKALKKKGWEHESLIIGDIAMWDRHENIDMYLIHPAFERGPGGQVAPPLSKTQQRRLLAGLRVKGNR